MLGPAHSANRDEEAIFVKPSRRRAGPTLEGTHALVMPPERPPPRPPAQRPQALYDRDGNVYLSPQNKGRRHDGQL